jgi:hypothetical protein
MVRNLIVPIITAGGTGTYDSPIVVEELALIDGATYYPWLAWMVG